MADTSTHNWKLLYEEGRQALQLRKLQEAEQSFSAALQLAEDFPAGDPRLAATLNALARIYSLQHRYLAAAALLNRLLEVTERTLGPSHVQVAGVLTNLAEMYTHLGATREELELRERVLAIRSNDANADAAAVRRLQERVTELRALIAAQEPPEEREDEPELETLPSAMPRELSAPIPRSEELAARAGSEEHPAAVDHVRLVNGAPPVEGNAPVEHAAPVQHGKTVESGSVVERAVAVHHAAAVEDAVPVVAPLATVSYVPEAAVKPFSGVPRVSIPNQAALASSGTGGHGSEQPIRPTPPSTGRKSAGWSNLYSVAAGVLLVAGLLAARSFVSGPSDDESVSTGSVNVANGAASATMTPVAQVTPAEPRTVERLIAEQRQNRDAKRSGSTDADVAREAELAESRARDEAPVPRPPRASAELERALRGVDGAVRAVDQRTRAAADSAMAIQVQAPTFKKVRLADP